MSMRIKTTQAFITSPTIYADCLVGRGLVLELPDSLAIEWVQGGLAVPERGYIETATIAPAEVAVNPKRKHASKRNQK